MADRLEPVADKPQRLIDGLLLKFRSVVAWVALTHHEYKGKAMSDELYDRFATARDETIPKLREEILAQLAAEVAQARAEERERCAKLCVENSQRWPDQRAVYAANECAAAIRQASSPATDGEKR